MKRFITLVLLMMVFGLLTHAQEISVKSFRALPTDMTASSLEGKRIDQNGQVAALIKVMTTETGFVFEGGTLGIVDTQQRVGEIWVWVPRASRKITILHQKLGGLREYRYPVEIESERTYEMVLATATIETIVKEEVRMQYLAFQITPPNAVLMVNEELWEVGADGTAMKFVDFGTYNYRVQAPNYHPDAGKVVVDNPKQAHRVTVDLKPDFVQVTLKVDADAEIWVNDEKKGTRSWTGPLGKGSYKIECKQAGYESTVTTQKITAEMDGQTITLPAPRPVYGSLNVESTPFATLYIDGEVVGETPYFIPEILIDQHELRLSKEGYADYTETITIAKGERKQVKATLSKQEAVQPTIANTTSTSAEDLTFEVDGVSFTMKFVEGGTFQMGATSEQGRKANRNEKPTHSVTLSTFMMGETEVTQALWKAVMGDNPSYYKGDNLPVDKVSWNDIQEFVRKLNQKTGKNFRLPTEAEWEYAARGGKKSKGYKFAGSNTIDDVAWYWDNSDWKCHSVKTKSPNELGLYDMSGNVWEWCQDWYGSYGSGTQTDPQGPSSGSFRVLRGGSWYYNARNCRVSNRVSNAPGYGGNSLGFRLLLPQ